MKALVCLLAVMATLQAPAEAAETSIGASNGVSIRKNEDAFSARYEYASPVIRATSEKGADAHLRVAKIRIADQLGPVFISGFIIYRGDWRYFTSAVYKGGDPVAFTKTDSRVGSCSGGCMLSEFFSIQLPPADVKKHSEAGVMPIQIRAERGDTLIVEIPVSYIDAVNEVAK